MATTATSKTPRKTAARKASAPTKTTAKSPARKAAPAKSAAQTTVKKVTAKSTVKVEKIKKPKLVRDSFTIPKSEYAVIDVLKMRGSKLAQPVKKSELLRAGIKALAAMTDIQFKAALADVPAIKTGRPKSAK